MTSPFSKDYKSQTADLIQKDSWKAEAGRISSARRKACLDSNDPNVRKQASGNLGRLSGIKTNPRINKSNSFCG